MKQQRGSTLVGFIVGLVVGLAIALGVAMYVTKVPVPFLHQSPSRSVDQDADELRKNKDWDPNAPLYGKNPARATSGAIASDSAATAPAAASSTPAKPVPLIVGAASAPKAAGSAAGDASKPRPAASGAVDPFIYFVQAGAFQSMADAEAQRAKLTLSGLDGKVTEREQSGRTVYRVRVGPVDSKEEADKVKERMDSAGFESALVRIQRQ